MGQDRPLELLDSRTGLEPEFLGQLPSELLVCLECLRLPPRAVQREHQLAAQPLAQRMAPSQIAKLAHQFPSATKCHVRFHTVLDRSQTKLLSLSDRRAGKRLVRKVCQRRTPPKS